MAHQVHMKSIKSAKKASKGKKKQQTTAWNQNNAQNHREKLLIMQYIKEQIIYWFQEEKPSYSK